MSREARDISRVSPLCLYAFLSFSFDLSLGLSRRRLRSFCLSRTPLCHSRLNSKIPLLVGICDRGEREERGGEREETGEREKWRESGERRERRERKVQREIGSDR